MKKETKNNGKSEVITGASSAVGATMGVMIGDALSSNLYAAETETNLQEEPEVEIVSSEPEVEIVSSEPEVTTAETNEPVSDQEPDEGEIKLLGFESVESEDGQRVDMAVLEIGGRTAVLADCNGDNVADVLAYDENGNQNFEDHEFVNVENEQISMEAFQTPVNQTDVDETILAENHQNDLDYINNANVNEYMA